MAQRTNLFTHPSAEGVGIAWTTLVGSNSVSRSTAQAYVGTESYAWVTTTSGSHEIITPTGTAGFPVTAGRSYYASAYFRSTIANTNTFLHVHWYNAAGTELSSGVTINMNSSTTAWQRIGSTFPAPAGAAFAAFRMRLTSTSGAQTVYLDGFLLEEPSTTDAYFDGSTDGGSWTGTAHASKSTYADPPYPRTNHCKNPSFEVDLTAWDMGGLSRVSGAVSGTMSAMTNSSLTTLTPNVAYGFANNAKTASAVAVVPGEVWTISFYAASVAVASHSVGIRTLWMNSSGAWVSDTGNPLNTTVVNGRWTRVVATVTVPAGIAWMGFAPVGSATIYMDGVLIEKAGFAGTYFDGSTSTPIETAQWTGTQHASLSTLAVATAPTPSSAAAESILLNAGIESPLPLVSLAAEPVLTNVLDKELVYDGDGPGLVGVYTGTITASANPTVNFTGTTEPGDVLIVAVVAGTNAEGATAVSGLGATWTRIPGAVSYLYSFWMGTGATGPGTITATGAAAASGKVVRVHHLRGVEPFAFMQATATYQMRLGSNQILIGYGYSTSANEALHVPSKVPGPGAGWIDQTQLTFLTGGNFFNTTVLNPSTYLSAYPLGGSWGMMMVVGSPVPGTTVTDRTLLYNGGFEGGTIGWTVTSGNASVGTDALFGTRCLKNTATGAAPQIQKFTGNTPGPYCLPGQTYTASAYVRSSTARNARVNLRWASTAGTFISATNGATTALPAGEWVRLTVTGVAPATAWVAGIAAELTDGISGDVLSMDGARVEEGSVANPFFDGRVSTPDRLNIDYLPGYYSIQTTLPAAPTPSVVGVFIGEVTTGENPTVAMTNTPARRDVLILTDARGHSSYPAPTAVEGCGATWTKIGSAEQYQSYWVGVGARYAGTITATASMGGVGRSIRVHHLRGVTPDVYLQHRNSAKQVVATPNQIVLFSGYSQSSSIVPVTPLEPYNGGWVVDTETAYAVAQRHNTATYIPRYPTNLDADVAAYGDALVIGSPFPGMSVTRRNLVGNSSFETGNDGWLSSGSSIGSRSLTASAVGAGSMTTVYNNNANPSIYRAYGSNSPMAPVVAGNTYTFSCWVRCNNARAGSIAPQWLSQGQGLQSTGTFSPAVALEANVWQRVSWTGVVPAGIAFAGVMGRVEGAQTGDVFWYDGFMIEEGATLGDYFDGWSDPPEGKRNYFVGMGDDSISMQVSPLPPVLDTSFNVLESGVWVNHVGTPKVYLNGEWVAVPTAYWNGTEWVDLIIQ